MTQDIKDDIQRTDEAAFSPHAATAFSFKLRITNLQYIH